MGGREEPMSLVSRLAGHKVLYPGNHDRCWFGHGRRATRLEQEGVRRRRVGRDPPGTACDHRRQPGGPGLPPPVPRRQRLVSEGGLPRKPLVRWGRGCCGCRPHDTRQRRRGLLQRRPPTPRRAPSTSAPVWTSVALCGGCPGAVWGRSGACGGRLGHTTGGGPPRGPHGHRSATLMTTATTTAPRRSLPRVRRRQSERVPALARLGVDRTPVRTRTSWEER